MIILIIILNSLFGNVFGDLVTIAQLTNTISIPYSLPIRQILQ
jgi:hypothetical protein